MKLLTVNETGEVTHRHPETVRAALQSEELHGYHAKKRSPWVIQEECAIAWRLGEKCSHQKEAAA